MYVGLGILASTIVPVVSGLLYPYLPVWRLILFRAIGRNYPRLKILCGGDRPAIHSEYSPLMESKGAMWYLYATTAQE